jgi:hypothetical protein
LLIVGGITLAAGVFVVAATLATVVLRHHPDKAAGRASSTTSTTSTPAASAAPLLGCLTAGWPAIYEGRPKTLDLKGPNALGVFLWHDRSGWHVRAVDAAQHVTFTLRIKASDSIAAWSVPAGTPPPRVFGDTASMTFTGSKVHRGFDFAMCKSNAFTIVVSTKPGPWLPHHTWIGPTRVAAADSIVIRRST